MGGGKRKPIPNRHRSVRSFDDHHSLAERLRCSPSPHKSSASHPSSSIVSLLPPFLSFKTRRSSIENSTLKSLSLEEQNEARRRKEGASINARSHRGSRDRWETREGGGRGARGGRAAHRRSICRGCQATNIHHQPTPSPSQPPPRASARRAPLRWRHLPRLCLGPCAPPPPPSPPAARQSRDALHAGWTSPRSCRRSSSPLAPYRKSHASREPSSPSSSSYSYSCSYSSASSSSCSAAAASPLPPAPPVRARLCCGRRGREHRHLGSLPAAILPLVRLAAQPRTTPNK